MNERQKRQLERYMKTDGAYIRPVNIMAREIAFFKAWQRNHLHNNYDIRGDMLRILVETAPQEWEEDTPIQGRHLAEWPCIFNNDIPDADREAALKAWGVDAPLAEIRRIWMLQYEGVSCESIGEGSPEAFRDSDFMIWPSARVSTGTGCIVNHSVRGYDILLEKGFGGLLAEVETEQRRFPLESVEHIRREAFLNGCALVCRAGLELGRRLAALAEKHNAPEIAADCMAVEHGATSLTGAVQLLWIGHLITVGDDGLNANSIGRLDQLLQPYYLKDLRAGRTDREKARELMTDLAIKLYQSYDVQAITLGGCDAEGRDACNDMTEIILDATEDFGQLRDLSLRVTPDTPDRVLEKAAGLVLRGGGIPFFLNDRCFVKALNDRGIALEDARNYAPIGCIEITIPGKADSRAVSGWFNMLKVIELTVNGGRDMLSGEQILPEGKLLTEYGSFQEFEDAFRENVRLCASHMVYNCRRGEKLQRHRECQLSFSLLTRDCIRRGRDITDGGAIYNWHSVCLMGVPDTADSLTALRKLVFEEKLVDPARLLKALREDFRDDEPLRQMLRTAAPKYGNDVPEADEKAAELSRYFIGLMDGFSEENSRFFVHLFTFFANVYCGKYTAATPNGRKKGTPFAYSLSAHPGMDTEGVAAMLHSLARQPHDMAAGASAAIIDLHPSMFNSGNPVKTFVALQKSAFDMGVGQVQWNVVSAEDMIRARNDPERYGTLQVRVAGYSQMFKFIEPKLQEHLIQRTKHMS